MRRPYVSLVSLACLSGLLGCEFDRSVRVLSELSDAQAVVGVDSEATTDDAGQGDPGTLDGGIPETCPAELHVVVSVQGHTIELGSEEPPLSVRIGDTVTLSAAQTCTRAGELTFKWNIDAVDSQVAKTVLPGAFADTISLFALEPGAVNVQLLVDNGVGQTEQVHFAAFQAVGFLPVESLRKVDVRDVSAGKDYVWAATKLSAIRVDPHSSSLDSVLPVNEMYGGDRIPMNTRAVHEDKTGRFVWFADGAATGTVYRLDLVEKTIQEVSVDANARVHEMANAGAGVRLATDQGVFIAADSEKFIVERPERARAIWSNSDVAWAGQARLYPLPAGPAISVFGTEADTILSIVGTGQDLWVGGNDKGVARLQNGVVQEIFTSENSDLVDNHARSMALDAGKDVWVATKEGVARFKQDRQIWVSLAVGSLGAPPLKAIAIADGRGGAVYVGGPSGLHVLANPTP